MLTDAELAAAVARRGRVAEVFGHHPDGRRWRTWRTYLDGTYLGNAVDHAEAQRWIADMIRLQHR